MTFTEGFIAGGLTVFIVYHFAMQPLLQKWRDRAIQKAKDELGKINSPKP